MSYSPISFIASNYRDYKNNWLKAFEPGTTTPKVLATDSTLSTLIAKAELNIDGFIKTAGGALIIPWVDDAYDLWLFPTEAEADSNDTSNALRLADNITGVNGAGVNQSSVKSFETLPSAVAETNQLKIFNGAVLDIKERTTGNLGGATWDVVLASGVTANTYNIVACTGITSLALVLRLGTVIDAAQFYTIGDNTGLQACLDTGASIINLQDGDYSFLTAKTVNDDTTQVVATMGAKNIDLNLFDKRVRRDGTNPLSDMQKISETINPIANDFVYISEDVNSDRFHVLTPTNGNEHRNKFRFDRSEGNFDDGGDQAGNRPYLLTQINRDEILEQSDSGVDDGRLIGAWTTSSVYQFSVTADDKAVFEFEGDELSILYLEATNAGIANIFIDGVAANLVPTLDMYSASGGSTRITVADNLSYSKHKVEIVVTGTKNASSSDFRVYLHTLQAYRVKNGLPTTLYKGNTTDFVTYDDTQIVSYKNINSAITYALGFRLASNGAATTPFIGSVHGFEELQSMKVYLDGVEQTDWLDGVGGFVKLRSARLVVVEHITKLVHPDDTGYFADITLTEAFTSKGYSQSYSLTWLQDITYSNGYSQMWVANGGIQGGVPGDVNGWCDYVKFNTGQNIQINEGDSSDHIHDYPTQVVMYGSPLDAEFPLRESEAGNMAMLVSFPDLDKSFDGFKGAQSGVDGVWVQDRNTIKKLYVQPFRTPNRDWATGEKIKGGLSVDVIYSDNSGAWNAFKD